MHGTIFREYDIRGRVGSEFVLDDTYDLACAIAYYFVQNKKSVKTVAVGMDGRVHSPAIKERVCKALMDSGIDVIFIGVCPSPVLYFALYTLPVDAGIMITASHNPKEYNGLKLCLGTESVWGLQVKEIGTLFQERKKISATRQGSLSEHPVIDAYVAWLANHFAHLKNMSLSMVVDCGNGAAGAVMPALVKAMGWQRVHLLYEQVDGTYPHHEADPVKEKNMRDVQTILATTDIELGVGFDGDADRMAPMTKSGYLVPGDRLLAVFTKQIINSGDDSDVAVVMDIKSSSGLLELLKTWGARACLAPSGHAIIKDHMKNNDALLGGELSCHFFFNDRYFGYDDGIYAMMRLCEIIVTTGQSLDALLSTFPKKFNSAEIHLECPEEKKRAIVEAIKAIFVARPDTDTITIDGVRATTKNGWGIVRASNTQPMLSLRFESDSEDGLRIVKEDFFAVLSNYFDATLLRQHIGI